MRIVGGSHRGRPLDAPPDRNTRPTTDRVRESLFNILAHAPTLLNAEGRSRIEGVTVIDAFAGSGALAFEALSRGARHAILFETDAAARRIILGNARSLKLEDRITLHGRNVLAPGPPPAIPAAGVVFLDPPWRTDLGQRTLHTLATAGWLAPDVLAIVESAKDEAEIEAPQGFKAVDTRQQGPARLTFLLRL